MSTHCYCVWCRGQTKVWPNFFWWKVKVKAVTKVWKRNFYVFRSHIKHTHCINFFKKVSAAVAQFLRLSDFELQSILRLYCEEEEREVQLIKNKYENVHWLPFQNMYMIVFIYIIFINRNREMKRRIKKRMQELKVKL